MVKNVSQEMQACQSTFKDSRGKETQTQPLLGRVGGTQTSV